MDWQLSLLTLYEAICKEYREHLWVYCQRFSTYVNLRLSDVPSVHPLRAPELRALRRLQRDTRRARTCSSASAKRR